MSSRIERVDVFVFERPRETPYLGALGEADTRLGDLYVVRGFNGTVYPTVDRSVVVRLRDTDGAEGWGETYGLVAPRATAEIVKDLFAPWLKASGPRTPDAAWDALYGLMRNRGYWNGYYADALAAVDIALWDLKGKREGLSLQALLGGAQSDAIPAYVSGLPKPTAKERIALAVAWQTRGFDSVKVPIGALGRDVPGEMHALREALGPEQRIALDLHWGFGADEAIALAEELEPARPWFIEAPVEPEDVEAQAKVASVISVPLALGEEWRSLWDYRPRRLANACSIVQPEMGHTGITQFMRIGREARAAGASVIPHATIGLGIFMAASLRAAAALGAEAHEFQHTVYGRNAALLDGAAECTRGVFFVEGTPGHGVNPNEEAFRFLSKID
ncbi:mandelate racemase/muconate lactonizing enzyme family protein [Chelativorans xinjiangense]|uniref:mandelate racemase/muconate lactonizing enzyme family protein n=1 Tax=Chelativorans xinjiangense TaxID=2681485 RepID=UPI00135868D0|nr:mandelate racemase/muconate lactonizing enzyme family protein [Chelativorans xinjiangense]